MNQLSAVDSVTGARERIGDLLRDGIKHVSYQVLDVLGYGTYGCIYLAKTVSTLPGSVPEYKAVKCLSKKGLSSAQLVLQRQEIDIHLSLSSVENGYHPHIVDMTSVIETKDSLYLVMEYCSGGDLYDAITSQHAAARDSGVDFAPLANLPGRFLDVHSDDSVLDAMTQIISALAHAHSRQVFHRDLKPENILVASNGSLKLADFGLATKERVSSDFGCGSSFYMAPEQQPSRTAAGRRPYLPSKSDVWSLGIIFLNLRFGRNPWKLSRVDMDATFAAYAQDPNILREMFPELSSSALYFLQRVLCVDPNDRADCFEALELIQRIDSILGDHDDVHALLKNFAAMEDCNEERVDSDLTLEDSSVGSSRSSKSSCSNASSHCSEDDEEEEDEIDSMFRMDDDYGAYRPNDANSSGNSRTRSCSSNWSMASSHRSGKSWSDMVEEEEMDFSLPVEFEEANATAAAANANTTPASLLASLEDKNSNNNKNNNTNSSNNSTFQSASILNKSDHTHVAAQSDDPDDDFTHHQQPQYPFQCYDPNYFNTNTNSLQYHHKQLQLQEDQQQQLLLCNNTNNSSDSLCLPQVDSSWSSTSTWVNDDFCFDFAHAGFTKLSELMFPGSSRPSSPTLLAMTSLHPGGFRLATNPL